MLQKPRLCRFQSLGPHGFHQVAYTEWGNPRSDHIVVCVHGLTRNSRDFDALATSLADRYRIVCMDVVGRGSSDWLRHKGDYGFPLYLSDAAALLARITAPLPSTRLRRALYGSPRGRPRVDWIGTSMGGLIGLFLAAKPRSPIRRLVLNDVGPMVPWSALTHLKGIYTGHGKRFADLDEIEKHLRIACAAFGPLPHDQWRHVAEHSALRKKDGSYVLAYDPGIMSNLRTGSTAGIQFGRDFFSGVDLWPMWDAVRCPTLVLRGGESDLLLSSTAEEMARRGTKARVVQFPGIGHAPWLRSADQIDVVREFLLAKTARAARQVQVGHYAEAA
jgi:pimeloyl-ACP methyl ester carboxylesterase